LLPFKINFALQKHHMKTITILLSSIITIAFPVVCLASIDTNQQSISSNAKLALDQSREVICGNGSTTYARAETKKYYVNICGNSSEPNLYLGAGKSGQAIVLPLKSHSNGKYVATSGAIRYTLTSSYLTVTQNGRTLLKERVISWR
jgi:hypothetical protein